jgi:hypothetical protein
MPILLNCTCGKKLRVPDENAGKKVRCPGCDRILTAVPEAEHAGDETEIIPATVRQEAVQRAPVRPPPLPAESVTAKPREREKIKVVKLFPVKGDDDEEWRLEMTEEEILLLDDAGDIAMRVAPEQAHNIIQVPSFWQSVKYIQFLGANGTTPEFQFQPDKKALNRIRSFLEHVLRRDPAARRNYKRKALGMLGAGVLSMCIGGAVLAYALANGNFGRGRGGTYGIVGLVVGLGSAIWGGGMYWKAARLEKQAMEEDE